ncbi:hypothetical protein [Amycolatopsis xylanica]|uniref:hypothetical protein n=1 Tax=Amycolatopsis xylanica TaxID=589385 RepID=UPI001FE1F7F7|nr:hypothetical protein [Amycolatopsis xylanica]
MTDSRFDQHRPLALHSLVYLDEGEEVTVGREDVDSYAILPRDGAALVRRLAAGMTPAQAGTWYSTEYGEKVDIDDVLECLDELGFLRAAEEAAVVTKPLRWQRLGGAVFSPAAWLLYAVVFGWAIIATVLRPDLVPHPRNIFFTDYYTLIDVVLFAVAIPLVLIHEAFHALAGRRIGVRSTLTVGRRLYFIVLETSLDGLVAVPRRKRYLPILAGMFADLLGVAILTVAADLTRDNGALSFTGKLCLAIVFAALMRVVWQFFFYLRTDVYVLISTVLGCVDLHTTAKRALANRWHELRGRPDRLSDPDRWHPADRKAARWYSWLIVAGYTVSVSTVLFTGIPIAYQTFAGVFGHFSGDASVTHRLDSIVFLLLFLGEVAVFGWLIVRDRRDRRRERRFDHVIS